MMKKGLLVMCCVLTLSGMPDKKKKIRKPKRSSMLSSAQSIGPEIQEKAVRYAQEPTWPQCPTATYDDVIDHLKSLKGYVLFTAREGGRECAAEIKKATSLLRNLLAQLHEIRTRLDLVPKEKSEPQKESEQETEKNLQEILKQINAMLEEIRANVRQGPIEKPTIHFDVSGLSEQIASLNKKLDTSAEIEAARFIDLKEKVASTERQTGEIKTMLQWERFKFFACASLGSILFTGIVAWLFMQYHDTEMNSKVQELV